MGGHAGTTEAGGDGELHLLGKQSEQTELSSESDSEKRVLQRLLDLIFTMILLPLAS